MTTTPALPPEVAATVPAWAWRLLAFLTAATGPVLSYWNPYGWTSDGARACLALGFAVIGAVLFLVHATLAAVHEHKSLIATAAEVESETIAAARELLPQMQALYTQAQPDLAKLPDYAALATKVDDVATKVQGIPVDRLTALLGAFQPPAAPAATSDPAAAGQTA